MCAGLYSSDGVEAALAQLGSRGLLEERVITGLAGGTLLTEGKYLKYSQYTIKISIAIINSGATSTSQSSPFEVRLCGISRVKA
jgi:hypothetical protein